MTNKVECLCITVDRQASNLGISQGENLVLNASEEWLNDKLVDSNEESFELTDLELGDLTVSISIKKRKAA